MGIELVDSDVLLVIDVQNDFCDGGPLAVPGGQDVVPVIHRIAALFQHAGDRRHRRAGYAEQMNVFSDRV